MPFIKLFYCYFGTNLKADCGCTYFSNCNSSANGESEI